MDKLDRLIEEVLSEEDRALMENAGELGFFAQLAGQLRGRNAWVSWMTSLGILLYAALLLWAGWHFFAASEALVALKWGMVAAVSVVIIGMLKLYLLGEMQTGRVIRELKRIELILASRNGG